MVYRVDQHFLAILRSSDALCDLIDLLPETDIRDEIKTALNMQLEILVYMLEGKHYGNRELNTYIKYVDSLKDEAFRLNREAEWKNE